MVVPVSERASPSRWLGTAGLWSCVVGASYRSVIFYENDEQKKIAEAYIAQLDAAHIFPGRIVTQVVPLKGFYDAESYHQHYADENPGNPYILVCDRPKIEALKQQFPELFQDNARK